VGHLSEYRYADMLKKYHPFRFLRHRFNLPPPASASTSEYSRHRNDDSMSDRISIAESVTVDSLEAMLEIQSYVFLVSDNVMVPV